MRRKVVIGCCLLPVIVIGGLIWWSVRALSGSAAAPARYATVQRGDVESKVTETGTIEALKKVEVKSKVGGRIARLYVQEGSIVRKGQLLVKIDPTEINSQVAALQAQLGGAKARQAQTMKGRDYQIDQTHSAIRQAEEALRSAEARLKVSQEQSKSQPRISGSSVVQAEANLNGARDSLTLMKNSTHPQALVQAKSAHDEAKAAEENSRRNLERQERLLDRGFVSQQVADAAKTDLAAVRARLDQAKSHLDLIEEQNRLELANAQSRVKQEVAALETANANMSQVPISKYEVAGAQAAVRQARAQLASAKSGETQDKMREDDIKEAEATVAQIENQLNELKVRQGDTTLMAPMTGVVTKRYIEQGELITSGVSSFSSGTPVLQVADLSRMLVKMSVNEVDVHRIRAGLPVEIGIDAARGVTFRGRVSRVAPAAIGAANPSGQEGQQASGQGGGGSVVRFAVEVAVDRADPRLKPGMTAKCALIIARKKNVLRLPIDGVTGTGAQATAQVVTPGHKDGKPQDVLTSRQVTVGLRGDNYIEIISGLKQGERVKPSPFSGPKRKDLDINID